MCWSINIFFIGKILSPLELKPRTFHKPSPTLYYFSQTSRACWLKYHQTNFHNSQVALDWKRLEAVLSLFNSWDDYSQNIKISNQMLINLYQDQSKWPLIDQNL